MIRFIIFTWMFPISVFCFSCLVPVFCLFPDIKRIADQKGKTRFACYAISLMFFWFGEAAGYAIGVFLVNIKSWGFVNAAHKDVIPLMMSIGGAFGCADLAIRYVNSFPPAEGYKPAIEYDSTCGNCGEPFQGKLTQCPMCGHALFRADR